MTAPVLSPAEQAEATRFGIHDEDVLRDMQERIHEVIPCLMRGCETPARVRIVTRCCGVSGTMCIPHLAWRRRTHVSTLSVSCGYCRASLIPFAAFDVIFRVVDL